MTLSRYFYNSKRLPKKLYLIQRLSAPISTFYRGGSPYCLDVSGTITALNPCWINTGYVRQLFGKEKFNILLKKKILRRTKPEGSQR